MDAQGDNTLPDSDTKGPREVPEMPEVDESGVNTAPVPPTAPPS